MNEYYCPECGNALELTWMSKWRCWHCGALYTEEEVRELEAERSKRNAEGGKP
jgi:rubredoxin